jgi:hypothetical protein
MGGVIIQLFMSLCSFENQGVDVEVALSNIAIEAHDLGG